MELCTFTAKTDFEPSNISLIAQIRLGYVRRKINLTLNTQQNTYVNLPLAEPWLLEIVCWHVTNGWEKETFGKFELNLANCIWSGGVHMPPAWYTLECPVGKKKMKKTEHVGKVKLQFTLLAPASVLV